MVPDRAGPADRIATGQRLGNDPSGVVTVVATGVAAETADAGAGDAAESCLNSFTAKTPVTMADGTKEAISKVKVGDKVLATDPQTGVTKAEPVAQLIRHTGKHVMVLIGLGGGSVLDATSGHPIWDATSGTFTRADDLRVGDRVDTTGGRQLTITSLRRFTADLTAYNLQIGQIHTYYAGVTPVLVHNSCDPENLISRPSQIADRFGASVRQVKDAIHQAKTYPGVAGSSLATGLLEAARLRLDAAVGAGG